MINTTEFVQLILSISVAFAIVAIALQLARLLGELTGAISDSRSIIRKVDQVSEMVVEDYNAVRGTVKGLGRIFSAGNKPFSWIQDFIAARVTNQSEPSSETEDA